MAKSNKNQSRYGDNAMGNGPNAIDYGQNRSPVVSPGYDTGQRITVKERSTNNMDLSDNSSIVSTTHRDPEPAMDPTKTEDDK